MMEPVQEIRDRLFALQDPEYRLFQSRLMPTVDPARVIGVRTPDLRKLSRELAGTEQAAAFVRQLPHDYYEENNLHGLLIASLRDYGETVAALESFLPHVDNWATCDLLHPRAFDKCPEALPDQLFRWLQSDGTYTVRFAMGMLMSLYLDEAFRPRYADWDAGVKSEEYYVNMMIAWYFATALAKQYDAAVPFLENRQLDVWTHNKAIQKAVESYRITPEQKAYLKTLKVKAGR